MKAATVARYGSPGVIEVRDVPTPVPGPDEVRVRVHAATVNRTDCGELLHPTLMRLLTGGRSRRTILGMDFSGIVEAVGAAAGLFKPGDRVFGMCPFRHDGAQAEYLCMPEPGRSRRCRRICASIRRSCAKAPTTRMRASRSSATSP